MKAIDFRQMFVPLLLGGALLAASLPALAERGQGHDAPHRDTQHYDQRKNSHHYHRSTPYSGKHDHQLSYGVVHRYYFPPAPMYAPPPRIVHYYEPAVVVQSMQSPLSPR